MSVTPGRPPRIGAEQIIAAGVALIDAEGIANLSMRRVGDALGVEAMALYRYFPSRMALLDALVESVVSQTASDPDVQLRQEDDWRDYLDRLAHGVRQMALTHPRVFPLVATHPTEAPWLRPPLRSVRWVDAFLRGLLDHHFPPPAAATVYKQFCTFLLGHLLLEVASLGLDATSVATAPALKKDRDQRAAEAERHDKAEIAEAVMQGDDAPDAEAILEGGASRPATVAEEPTVVAAVGMITDEVDGDPAAVVTELDLPVAAAVASTASLDLSAYPQLSAMAGLLARNTAGEDFDRDLGRLLDGIAKLRRP